MTDSSRRAGTFGATRSDAARRHLARRALGVAAAIVLATRLDPASGLTFIYTTTGTVPQNVIDGFTAAGDRWSANFSDNVTVRVTIGYSALGANVIGSAGSTTTDRSYSLTRSALVATATSTDDTTAVASLANTTGRGVYLNGTTTNPNGSGSSTPWLDDDGDANNTTVRINRANARALGFIANTSTSSDVTITFSSDFSFDFDPRDGVAGNAIDFVGIAAHEIGHALGFTSGVDTLDGNFTTLADSSTRLTTLDLFRYSAGSIAQGPGVVDATADTRTKYISLDGGSTSIGNMSTGVAKGDGRQASHWKDNSSLGIMDPTAGFGEKLTISENDRRAFDVIGWTRDYTWEWTYAAGGSFQEVLNWNANGVPGAAQDAVFALGQTYGAAVTTSANVNVRDLIVRNDQFALTPNTSTRTVTVSRNFTVGDTDNATAALTFTQGLLTTSATAIATTALSAGTFSFTGGTWTNTGSIAVGGTQSTAGGAGLLVRSSPGALTVSGTLKVWGNGRFNASVGSSTIATLDVAAGGQVTLASGSMALTSTVNAGTITQTGGTLTLGTVTGTGTLSIATLATARSVRQGSVIVAAGGTLTIVANGSNAAVSQIGTLTLANNNASLGTRVYSASFDLVDNDLVLTNTSEAIARDMVRAWWNNGQRNGQGLRSSLATLSGSGLTTLAVVSNTVLGAGTFAGVSLSSTDVLVKYTYLGDTNLDGTVDGTDLARLVNGLRRNLTGWYNGDTNYDGLVNGVDYANLTLALRSQGASLSDDEAIAGVGSIAGVIPEPGALGLVLAGGLGLGRRRKR